MGSKKFKDKLCVYCRKNSSSTADHIFPRELFLIRDRKDIHKVPCCTQCNNTKSKLELYLTSVLPFSGTHYASHPLLKTVKKRLKKNNKLYQYLHKNHKYEFNPHNNPYRESLYIPLDYKKLHEFCDYVGKALYWIHSGKYLNSDASSVSFTPSRTAINIFQPLMREPHAKISIEKSIGNGTIKYKGCIGNEKSLTIFAIQLLGGITVVDSNSNYTFKNSFIFFIAGSPKLINNFEELLD